MSNTIIRDCQWYEQFDGYGQCEGCEKWDCLNKYNECERCCDDEEVAQ